MIDSVDNVISTSRESLEKESPGKLTVIGDLDGDIQSFKSHLLAENCIKCSNQGNGENWEWIGGDRELILLGDILADRVPTSFLILQKIHELRKQGAKISTLTGNHDIVAIRLLMNLDRKNKFYRLGELSGFRGFQYFGLQEFFFYLKEYVGQHVSGDQKIARIRKNMQSDNRGKIVLEEISNMRLLDLQGNRLILHTPLTQRMLDGILHIHKIEHHDTIRETLLWIDDRFSTLLRKGIKNGELLPGERGEFASYITLFLRTWNGRALNDAMKKDMKIAHDHKIDILGCHTPQEHPAYDLIKKSGITDIVHGHVHEKQDPPPDTLSFVNLNRSSTTYNGGKDENGVSQKVDIILGD